MEIGYQSKEDGQISVVKDANKTPVSKFPPCTYKRLYEIASVDVSKKNKTNSSYATALIQVSILL